MTPSQKTKLEKLAKGSNIMAVVAQDTLDSTGHEIDYLKDIVNNGGCSGGSCTNLIYYADTHAFYQKYSDECDEIFHEYESLTGEGYMFKGRDVQNTLAWMAYEERARQLYDTLEDLKDNENE